MSISLLTTGQGASVVFKPTSNAAWAALASIPGTGFGGALTDAVVNGTPLIIYVTDAASGSFSFIGGSAFGYDDTLLVSASTILFTKTTFTSVEGLSIIFLKSAVPEIYTVDPSSGTIQTYLPTASPTLKAFLI